MFSTAIRNPASSASGVTPAQCGVMTTFESCVNGWPGGRGSVVNTSSPAPAIRLEASASSRARLVHDRAARGVDENGARLHETEFARADDSGRLGREPQMDADDVARAIQFVEFDDRIAGFRMHGPGDHAHAEARREPGKLTPDRAEPDDPAGLAVKLDRLTARPLARARRRVHARNSPRDGEEQRQCVLRNRNRRHAGSVGDYHVVPRGGRKIDMIGARAPDREQAQARTGIEHAVGESRRGADVEDDFGVADARNQSVFGARECVVIVELSACSQFRPNSAGAENGRSVVGNVNFESHLGHG